MHDFGKIVYLDLHKTGSAFTSKFLRSCCLLKEKKFSKHGFIKEDYDSNNFYFITIRHPVQLYSSLFRYGLDEKGDVWNRLRNSNNLSVYSSFNSFVEFCIDESNANLLGYGYNQIYAKHIGFMSFRFLKLSLQFPRRKILHTIETKANIEDLENLFITNLEIKTENLIDELRVLATEIHPKYFKQDAVNDFLNKTERLNTSSAKANTVDGLSDKTLSILNIKERLLFSRYQ